MSRRKQSAVVREVSPAAPEVGQHRLGGSSGEWYKIAYRVGSRQYTSYVRANSADDAWWILKDGTIDAEQVSVELDSE